MTAVRCPACLGDGRIYKGDVCHICAGRRVVDVNLAFLLLRVEEEHAVNILGIGRNPTHLGDVAEELA